MFELLLVVVASAACLALGFATARARALGRPDLGRVARAGGVAACVFVAGALGAGPSPLSVAGLVAGAWMAGACVLGAIVGELGALAAGPPAGPGARAGRTIIVQASALLGLALALFAACAATGALKHPESFAPGAARLVIGFACGAALSDAAHAEIAIEAVLAMIPLAAVFERNAAALRAGPVAVSAIGLFVLPLAMRALGLLALGASAKVARGDSRDARRGAPAAWVFVSLAALATFGASFALAGVFWPSTLFCGVAGVGAALVAWRAAAGASTAWLPLAALGGALVASVGVVARAGLAHPMGLALPLVVVGARMLLSSLDALEEPAADVAPRARWIGAALLAPLGALATADAASAGACARWAARDQLPDVDPAALFARCEAARVTVDHLDLLRPGALVGAAVGAVLVLDAPDEEGLVARGARGLVAVVTCVAMRLAFESGATAAAAMVGAALVAAAVGRRAAQSRVAWSVGAAVVALTPLFA